MLHAMPFLLRSVVKEQLRQCASYTVSCCSTCKESSKAGSIFHDSSNMERCEPLGTRDACQQIHPHATRPF